MATSVLSLTFPVHSVLQLQASEHVAAKPTYRKITSFGWISKRKAEPAPIFPVTPFQSYCNGAAPPFGLIPSTMVGQGAKRNTPCWCGSGRKLKKCHLNREDEEPAQVYEALRAEKNSQKKTCLSPLDDGCNRVISAHSIQKMLLKRIAKNGHVISVGPTNLGRALNHGFDPHKIGVGKASAFTGFCGKHDKSIFQPIEDFDIECSQEHAFLLGYRAICMELYKKTCTADMLPAMRSFDRGLDLQQQEALQAMATEYLASIELGIGDIQAQKQLQDSALCSGDFHSVRGCFVTFSEPAPWLACTSIQPEHDFNGRAVQGIRSRRQGTLDTISFSLVESRSRGLAVFSWIEGNTAAQDLVESLMALSREEQGRAILRFAFEYTENLFMSPTWWEGLDRRDQEWIKARYLSSIESDRTYKALVEDGSTPSMISVCETKCI